ncbi:hypothetical protein ACJIZ3_012083 [Penstemon smallii]|uniref:BZIP domain-containing protein n=1 Tax=Penstemon smallii TaxID=265156 RepID=A0ABD3UN46_9LAMI
MGGIQMMNSHETGSGYNSHTRSSQLTQQLQTSSCFNLTFNEIKNQLGDLGKPLGNMNVDELLNNVLLTAESKKRNSISTSPASSLQRQASLSLAMAFSGRTVDEVWRDIQQGDMTRNVNEREPTLGETTLEDFLVKAGLYVSNSSLGHAMSLDSALYSKTLSPSNSFDEFSDTPIPGRKRGCGDIEKSVERRLRRKIKNRESAARSRARKQAYHDELVIKVSHLEEEIGKLKKEKNNGYGAYLKFADLK